MCVQAFDSGSPAMSTTVSVNIEIADVNDNPPAFSPANASASIQVSTPYRIITQTPEQEVTQSNNFLCSFQLNKPVGTSVLILNVSDADSPRNGGGGPFNLRIVSGNENDAFSLDRNGELRSNKVFKPAGRREYILEIQVSHLVTMTLVSGWNIQSCAERKPATVQEQPRTS